MDRPFERFRKLARKSKLCVILSSSAPSNPCERTRFDLTSSLDNPLFSLVSGIRPSLAHLRPSFFFSPFVLDEALVLLSSRARDVRRVWAIPHEGPLHATAARRWRKNLRWKAIVRRKDVEQGKAPRRGGVRLRILLPIPLVRYSKRKRNRIADGTDVEIAISSIFASSSSSLVKTHPGTR